MKGHLLFIEYKSELSLQEGPFVQFYPPPVALQIWDITRNDISWIYINLHMCIIFSNVIYKALIVKVIKEIKKRRNRDKGLECIVVAQT